MSPRPASEIVVNATVLKAVSKERGLTKTTLALKAGYSVGYISDLESGHRTGTAATIADLAAALDVPEYALELRRDP